MLVPCFNSSKMAFEVLHGLKTYVGILLAVNDGSTDDTADWLKLTPAEIIGWPVNRGKGHALTEGMRVLWGKPDWDVMLTVDSDGQHDPDDLPKLVKTYVQTQASIVIGARDFKSKQAPWIRRLANSLSSRLICGITGLPVSDIQSGYRLYSRTALQHLLPHLHGGSFEFETEILLLANRLDLEMRDTPIRTIYNPDASIRSSWRAFYHSRLIFQTCLRHLLRR